MLNEGFKTKKRLKRLRGRARFPPSALAFTQALFHCVTAALSCAVREKNLHVRAKAAAALGVVVSFCFFFFFLQKKGVCRRKTRRVRGGPAPGRRGGPGRFPPVQTGSRAQTTRLSRHPPRLPRSLRLRRPGAASPSPHKGTGAREPPAFRFNTPGEPVPAPAALSSPFPPPGPGRHYTAGPRSRRQAEATRRPKAAAFQSEIKISCARHIFNRLL